MKPGAAELLEYLFGNKIPLGLASSTRLATVTQELQAAGLYDYFQVVVGGDLLKKSKPAPDIYLMTCERMGVLPKIHTPSKIPTTASAPRTAPVCTPLWCRI